MAKGKYEKWLEPDGLILLEGWARDGLTDEQIAHNCGIRVSTLYEWKNRFVEITDALKKGKEITDYEVQGALRKKCVGYYVPEEVAFKCRRVFWDEKGRRCEEEEIKTTTVQRYIPPDTMAEIVWLNNRKPEQFRRNAGKEKLDDKKFEHEQEIDRKRFW